MRRAQEAVTPDVVDDREVVGRQADTVVRPLEPLTSLRMVLHRLRAPQKSLDLRLDDVARPGVARPGSGDDGDRPAGYGLYRVHGYVNAKLAQRTGFTGADLDLVKEALNRMYDLDRSAARGEMAARRCIAFRHVSDLGNAPAHKLFERVSVHRVHDGASVPIGDKRSDNWPPARSFSHYDIRLDTTAMPDNVGVEEWIV
jgi:CRISPR-associated protein Cas7